jgi:hypothetical protein
VYVEFTHFITETFSLDNLNIYGASANLREDAFHQPDRI